MCRSTNRILIGWGLTPAHHFFSFTFFLPFDFPTGRSRVRPMDLAAPYWNSAEIPFLVKVLSGWGQSYEIIGRWRTNRITRQMGPTINFNLGLSLNYLLICVFHTEYTE